MSYVVFSQLLMHMFFKSYVRASVWASVARCTCQEPGTDMFNDMFNDLHPLAAFCENDMIVCNQGGVSTQKAPAL